MPSTFVILALTLGFFFSIWWGWHTWEKGAPYEGMNPEVVERAMKIVEIGPKDVFYDLGSGDGRVVIAAALRGAKAYGVEIDRLRVVYSRFWIRLLGLNKQAKIIHGDIFKTKIGNATVVCTYLLPETHERLEKKLKKELKKGTKIAAVGFKYKGWKSERQDVHGPVYGPIMLYRI